MKFFAAVLCALMLTSCSSPEKTFTLEKVETKMSQSYGPVQAKVDYIESKDGNLWFNVELMNLSQRQVEVDKKDFILETSGPEISISDKTPMKNFILKSREKMVVKMAFDLSLNASIDSIIFRYSSNHSEMQEFFNVTH
ncbi:putative lipoprotein [Bacteriovorax sp. BSW11_IV]|uniref:hypothetical protein n=1 Tax=Bacteriovorax sp. BSW11_IV TaxID=1353529 RepID=UPI00038A09BD|nr:hypothetical protein [Bacteriovorax sp. BSW11_IV]EQC48158.1 putative lipoprotein [Bacteriovorax sp. BSW11_IV]